MASAPSLLLMHHLYVGGVAKPELLLRLQAAGVRLNAFADALFADDRFTTLPEPSLVHAVEISVAQLGLRSGGTFAQVVEQAAARELVLCPLELGPHLRLALMNQSEGSVGRPPVRNCAPPGSMTVASAPLSADENVPKGFYLRVIDGVPWLRGYRSWSGNVWNADDVFVFARSQNAV